MGLATFTAVGSSFVVQGGKAKIKRAPAQGRATADNPTKATF